MKRNVIYISIFLLIISCQNDLNTQDTTYFNSIRIQANPVDEQLAYEPILDSVVVIPLEFTEESALKRIYKVRIWQNRIVVMDELLEEIFLYDLNVKFIQKFNAYGKGPGEILSIADMEIDQHNDLLLLLSRSSKSISRYNIKDLSFMDRIEPTFFPSSFAINQKMDHLAFQVGYYQQQFRNTNKRFLYSN